MAWVAGVNWSKRDGHRLLIRTQPTSHPNSSGSDSGGEGREFVVAERRHLRDTGDQPIRPITASMLSLFPEGSISRPPASPPDPLACSRWRGRTLPLAACWQGQIGRFG